MRENRTYSLSGGRWLARPRATSDPTPMNPSNKATEQPSRAAEREEERAPTKENIGQNRTPPAQDGSGVSQGLARVRKVAYGDFAPVIRGKSRMR